MKTRIFLIAIFSLFIGKEIFAQQGTTPYVGSKHIYFVNSNDNGATHTRADGISSYRWYVTTDLAGSTAANTAHYTIEESTWDEGTDGINGAAVNNLYKINITWNSGASLTAPYYLFVEERDISNTCVSIRRTTINVQANAFDITLAAAPADACNSVSGNVFTGVTPLSSELSTTTKDFTINATGTVNSWKFKPLVSDNNSAGAAATYKYNNGSADVALTLTDGYITVPPSATPYSVVATVTVNNLWDADNTVITIDIDAGEDVLYGTLEITEVGGATYAATASTTIKPLPLTSEISTN